MLLPFVFIHVPKTGGRSVGAAIRPLVPAGMCPSGHRPAHIVDGIENCFSFAFVRNPWDRMVSLWRFFRPDLTLSEYIALENPSVFGKTQSWFINDKSGKLMVSFVGRFEYLRLDFGLICDKIGIEAPKLGHLNKTNHTNYRDYYCADTREMVDKRYAEDIDTLGYVF